MLFDIFRSVCHSQRSPQLLFSKKVKALYFFVTNFAGSERMIWESPNHRKSDTFYTFIRYSRKNAYPPLLNLLTILFCMGFLTLTEKTAANQLLSSYRLKQMKKWNFDIILIEINHFFFSFTLIKKTIWVRQLFPATTLQIKRFHLST